MAYNTNIGIETHVQLKTQSKLFCTCSTRFGKAPNSQTCPVCLGLPGVLPVVNRHALQQAIAGVMALNCSHVEGSLSFDRKNFYYPDLPKGYQISQHHSPLGRDGFLTILAGEKGEKKIPIRDVHLEEDTGKIVHLAKGPASHVDLNRAGIPLLEIVTCPALCSPEEAFEFVKELRLLLQYAGISDCNIEEGRMRCEGNLSIREESSDELGCKVEIKNIGSLRGVYRALQYEKKRQIEILERAGRISRETRGWDDEKGVTFLMRSKEESQDYRYFPEPDLPPHPLEKDWINKIHASLPELPQAKKERFIKEQGLSLYDAGLLVQDPSLADFFEALLGYTCNAKAACNWVNVELRREIGERCCKMEELALSPAAMGQLVEYVEEGRLSTRMAREVFREMVETGMSPERITKKKDLYQISDEKRLSAIITEAVLANPKAVEDVRGGKEKARDALVGFVMKKTRGKANPKLVKKLLDEVLGGKP